jgi:hypothetical protein
MRWSAWCHSLFLLFAQAYILKEWMFIGFGLFLHSGDFNLGCGVVVFLTLKTITMSNFDTIHPKKTSFN